MPATLAECPNCACGVAPDSALCEFCSAILTHAEHAPYGLSVVSILCIGCGRENEPSRQRCTGCGMYLVRACPRCQEEMPPATWSGCPRCGLPRDEFYEECLRSEAARQRAKGREQKRALIVGRGLFAVVVLAP